MSQLHQHAIIDMSLIFVSACDYTGPSAASPQSSRASTDSTIACLSSRLAKAEILARALRNQLFKRSRQLSDARRQNAVLMQVSKSARLRGLAFGPGAHHVPVLAGPGRDAGGRRHAAGAVRAGTGERVTAVPAARDGDLSRRLWPHLGRGWGAREAGPGGGS